MRRLKLIEQSVGIPFEMSLTALITAPVGRVICIGDGFGSDRSMHGGMSSIFCTSTLTGISKFGMRSCDLVQIGLLLGETMRRHAPPGPVREIVAASISNTATLLMCTFPFERVMRLPWASSMIKAPLSPLVGVESRKRMA